MHDYTITFACFNSVEYTKKCVTSLIEAGTPLGQLVVVDNGSQDGTREYLASVPFGEVVLNKKNLGCGVAWNQGALVRQSEWTIIMNNDVLVNNHWVERLIDAAERLNVKVISPAMIEGVLDYDFMSFGRTAESRMLSTERMGGKHAVCLAVHSSVWSDVGYFTPKPQLLGYEDTLFFNDLERAGISTAITGAVWIHHFGSVTQNQMKKEQGLASSEALGNRLNYKMLGLSWSDRKIRQLKRKSLERRWNKKEKQMFDMTLHGVRVNGDFIWR
jgi:GT2 family glycosyltransferase